jgi:cell division transport system permease protein
MKISTLTRHLREGIRSLGRNGWMTFASVSAVMVTLLILGVFLVLAMNIQAFTRDIENQVQMDVIVADGTTKPQIQSLEADIAGLPSVKSVRYVSKEQGLEDLKKSLGPNGSLIDGLENDNPLPDKFVVQAVDPRETDTVAAQIRNMPHVDQVIYGKDTIDRLFRILTVVRDVGAVLILALMVTAMFLISNTIKVTIFARRREIEIMKLVGATNGFIRWPLFVEGTAIGMIGSLIPILIIAIAYHSLVARVPGFYSFQFLSFHPLVDRISLTLLLIGAFIGVWGSMVSIRKFLRI